MHGNMATAMLMVMAQLGLKGGWGLPPLHPPTAFLSGGRYASGAFFANLTMRASRGDSTTANGGSPSAA